MKRKNASEQREKIFYAAAHVMVNNGSFDFTMEEVANKLQGTKGTLYYYFKSKSELLYAMQIYAFDMLDKAMSEAQMKDIEQLNPCEYLKANLIAYGEVFFENWELMRALWTDTALYGAPPELKRVITRRRRQFEEKYSVCIADAYQYKGLSCPYPDILAKLALGQYTSISRWYRQRRKGIAPKEMAKIVSQMILEGIYLL